MPYISNIYKLIFCMRQKIKINILFRKQIVWFVKKLPLKKSSLFSNNLYFAASNNDILSQAYHFLEKPVLHNQGVNGLYTG